MAALRLPKPTCVFERGMTPRTLQAVRMKILLHPSLGKGIVRNLKQWKVHATRISSRFIAVNSLHLV
jgi:hypothetical protein